MINMANNPAWLEWMTTLMGEASQTGLSPEGASQDGLLHEGLAREGTSRQTDAATFLPDRFYCLLDELPLHLIPRRTFKSLQLQPLQPTDQQLLYLNPD